MATGNLGPLKISKDLSTNNPQNVDKSDGKDKGGRPCEYCKDKDRILESTNKYIKDCNNPAKLKIPYIEELAIILDVDDDTIVQWAAKKNELKQLEHPEFSAAIKKLKTVQKFRLLNRTLGRFNPTGAIFQLKANHNMIETEKQIHAGDKGAPVELNVKIVEDKNKETPEANE